MKHAVLKWYYLLFSLCGGYLYSTGQNTNAIPSPANLVRSAKNLLQPALPKVDLFRKGQRFIKLTDMYADINYAYLRDTTGIATGLLKDIQYTLSYDVGFQLSFSNMPFDLRFAGNQANYQFYRPDLKNFTQFNFNHKKYIEQVQKLVGEKINPDQVAATVLSRINKIKDQYQNALVAEIRKIQQSYESAFGSALELPQGITDLSIQDMSSLRSAIIPGSMLEQYQQAKQFQDGATGALSNPAFLATIRKVEALEKIYEKFTDLKSKLDANPVVRELRSHLPFSAGNFKSYLKNPSRLVEVAKNHASLGSLQRLFLNVTKLDIGSNPITGGEFNIQNLLNKGVNTEFTGKRSSFGAIYGNGSSNINSWMQSGLNSFISNEYSGLGGIKFGSGWNSQFKQSISLNFFDFRDRRDISNLDPALLQAGYVSAPAHRDAVITWESSFNLSPKHKLSVDLSRSFGAYRNSFSADSSTQKNNPFENIFSGEGRSNYAAAIDYKGNLFKTDVRFFIKKAGLGYNNPGNVFVRKGESRVGLGITKKFLKQKLSLKYKTDLRSQHFDPGKNYSYSSFSNDIQGSYKLNRNNRFGFTYRQNAYRYVRKHIGETTKGNSYTLQADAGYNLKLDKMKLINNTSLASQKFDMPVLSGSQYISRTWLFTHSSSVLLKKNLLTATLMANRSDNKDYYFNTSFLNAELSYGYAIGESIRLSSGAGFYSNTGWNKQVGFRQQLSGTVLRKFGIDIDVNYKKAVKIIRPELANELYVGASLQYRF
jgi:hypothetical protein